MSLPISCHSAQFGTLGQIDPSHLAEIVKQGYKSVIMESQVKKRSSNPKPQPETEFVH